MRRVLVLCPHPDDEAVGCGGTLRRHADAGDDVHVVFLTSGEAGGHGLANAAAIREAEAAESARILGVAGVEFWRERDSGLRASQTLVERMRQSLHDHEPDLVYAPHGAEMHADHRAAHRLLRRALKGSNGRGEVLLYEVWTPLQRIDHVVDVSAQIEDKLAAIRAYRSQCDVLRFDDAFLGLARYRGEMFSWPERGYAEVFQRVTSL